MRRSPMCPCDLSELLLYTKYPGFPCSRARLSLRKHDKKAIELGLKQRALTPLEFSRCPQGKDTELTYSAE